MCIANAPRLLQRALHITYSHAGENSVLISMVTVTFTTIDPEGILILSREFHFHAYV